MSDDYPLSQHVISEIKAWIGKRDMNKSELARRLGVSHTWVSNRLAGQQEIGIGELERIAAALEVEIGDLLPKPALTDERPGRRNNERYSNAPRSAQLATTHPTPTHPPDGRPIPRTAVGPRSRPAWTHDGVAA